MGLCEVNSKNNGCAEHRLNFHVMGTGRAGISVLRLKQCTARGRGCFHFFSNQICLLKGRIQIRKYLRCHRNSNCMVLAERIRESSLAGLRGTE